MSKLLFSALVFLSISDSSLFAQAQDAGDFEDVLARVRARPVSAAEILDEATVDDPGRIGDLLVRVMAVAEPDRDELAKMLRVCVRRFPDRSGMIGEAAILAAPEKADMIRGLMARLSPDGEGKTVADSGSEATGTGRKSDFSPGEKEPPRIIDLSGRGPGEKTGDEAERAIRTIDLLLEKLTGRRGDVESSHGGEISLSLSRGEREQAVSTLVDSEPRELRDEGFVVSPAESLVLRDRPEEGEKNETPGE